jgi:hypothetical protein
MWPKPPVHGAKRRIERQLDFVRFEVQSLSQACSAGSRGSHGALDRV